MPLVSLIWRIGQGGSVREPSRTEPQRRLVVIPVCVLFLSPGPLVFLGSSIAPAVPPLIYWAGLHPLLACLDAPSSSPPLPKPYLAGGSGATEVAGHARSAR